MRTLIATAAASLTARIGIALAATGSTTAGNQLFPLHVSDTQEQADDPTGLGRCDGHHHRSAGLHHLDRTLATPAVVNQLRGIRQQLQCPMLDLPAVVLEVHPQLGMRVLVFELDDSRLFRELLRAVVRDVGAVMRGERQRAPCLLYTSDAADERSS